MIFSQFSSLLNLKKLYYKGGELYSYYGFFDLENKQLTMIDIKEAYGILSTQDAIDTLEAIKSHANNAFDVIEDMIKSMKESISNQ